MRIYNAVLGSKDCSREHPETRSQRTRVRTCNTGGSAGHTHPYVRVPQMPWTLHVHVCARTCTYKYKDTLPKTKSCYRKDQGSDSVSATSVHNSTRLSTQTRKEKQRAYSYIKRHATQLTLFLTCYTGETFEVSTHNTDAGLGEGTSLRPWWGAMRVPVGQAIHSYRSTFKMYRQPLNEELPAVSLLVLTEDTHRNSVYSPSACKGTSPGSAGDVAQQQGAHRGCRCRGSGDRDKLPVREAPSPSSRYRQGNKGPGRRGRHPGSHGRERWGPAWSLARGPRHPYHGVI